MSFLVREISSLMLSRPSTLCSHFILAVLHAVVVTPCKPAVSLEHRFLPNRCRCPRSGLQERSPSQYLLAVPLWQPLLLLPVTHGLYATCARRVPSVSQKLVCVALACLPHVARRQAVSRQCRDGNAGVSAQVRPTYYKESLHLVWQPYSLHGQLSYIALCP